MVKPLLRKHYTALKKSQKHVLGKNVFKISIKNNSGTIYFLTSAFQIYKLTLKSYPSVFYSPWFLIPADWARGETPRTGRQSMSGYKHPRAWIIWRPQSTECVFFLNVGRNQASKGRTSKSPTQDGQSPKLRLIRKPVHHHSITHKLLQMFCNCKEKKLREFDKS